VSQTCLSDKARSAEEEPAVYRRRRTAGSSSLRSRNDNDYFERIDLEQTILRQTWRPMSRPPAKA